MRWHRHVFDRSCVACWQHQPKGKGPYPRFWGQHFSVVLTITYYLTCLLTFSIVQSPSGETNWLSASQEIPSILWKPKVHYRIYSSRLSQISPVHAPSSHFLKINTLKITKGRSLIFIHTVLAFYLQLIRMHNLPAVNCSVLYLNCMGLLAWFIRALNSYSLYVVRSSSKVS